MWLLRVWSAAHALDEELEVRRSRGLAFCMHEVHCFLLHVCVSNHVGIINLIQEHTLKVILAIQLRWCKPKRVSLHLVGKHAYYTQIGAFQSLLFAFFKFIKYQELYVILIILLAIVTVLVNFRRSFLVLVSVWRSQGRLLLACPENRKPAELCQKLVAYWRVSLMIAISKLFLVISRRSFAILGALDCIQGA